MDDSTPAIAAPTSQPGDDSQRPTAARPPRRPRREQPAAPPALPAVIDHPLTKRHYRVATAAIEAFVKLVEMCVRLMIPGALIHARPRMGKTHAIDYVALHMERHRPELLVLRLSCEHHRTEFEGPFFSALLGAAGVRDENLNSNAKKRFALMCRLREQLMLRRVEWLRDVHDQLGGQGSRMITFLVGQPQLLERKAQYQLSGDEQIVARFMIEQLHFRGITDAADAATDRVRRGAQTGTKRRGAVERVRAGACGSAAIRPSRDPDGLFHAGSGIGPAAGP